MIDKSCNKNIFQIWRDRGDVLPFEVIRWSWSPSSSFLVEQIEVGKWPYGKAWGRFIKDGRAGPPQKLDNAGSYQWKAVEGGSPPGA